MKDRNKIRKGFLLEMEGTNITSWIKVMPDGSQSPEESTYSFNVADLGSRDVRDSMFFNSLGELAEAYNHLSLFLHELLKDRELPEEEENENEEKEEECGDPEGGIPSEELTFKGRYVSSSFSMEPGANHGDEDDAYFVEVKTGQLPAGTLGFSSFDELEEFFRQLSRYVERRRKLRE